MFVSNSERRIACNLARELARRRRGKTSPLPGAVCRMGRSKDAARYWNKWQVGGSRSFFVYSEQVRHTTKKYTGACADEGLLTKWTACNLVADGRGRRPDSDSARTILVGLTRLPAYSWDDVVCNVSSSSL